VVGAVWLARGKDVIERENKKRENDMNNSDSVKNRV